MISPEEILRAHARIKNQILRTACEKSDTLSAQLGCELFIKFENQQFTASFKERGALNRLMARAEELTLKQASPDRSIDSATTLTPRPEAQGVIAMSAGNHAQALAYHGQRLGVPTTIVMPRSTPNAKVEATRVFGAEVILQGVTFDETREFTKTLAVQRNLELIHPFDDADVIAGQGTVAIELLEQVQDLDIVVVPIGGGGLISGVAAWIKYAAPGIEVIGVQMSRYQGAYIDFHKLDAPVPTGTSTVAEGIAVKTVGKLTRDLIGAHVDEVLLVEEAEVEQAIFDLLELEKTVAEGAGAAPLALLRKHAELGAANRFAGKRVGMILSGGNIDMMIMSSVLQRGLVRSHRLVRIQVEVSDSPGSLAELTTLLGKLDSNIIDIAHQRTFGGSSVRATLVELVLQMRGEEQFDTVQQALASQGYDLKIID